MLCDGVEVFGDDGFGWSQSLVLVSGRKRAVYVGAGRACLGSWCENRGGCKARRCCCWCWSQRLAVAGLAGTWCNRCWSWVRLSLCCLQVACLLVLLIAVGQARLAGLLGSVVDSCLPKTKVQRSQGSRQIGWLAAGTLPQAGGAPPPSSPSFSPRGSSPFLLGWAGLGCWAWLWSVPFPAAATADPL
jgi:hypothetical protein